MKNLDKYVAQKNAYIKDLERRVKLQQLVVYVFGIVMVILALAPRVCEADPQDPDVMACTNGEQVIYVTNYTCPAGWWPL